MGDVFKADFHDYKGFDMLIGGSPCTYWSIAQKAESRETTNSGLGWDLFSQYIRALKEGEIPYFLYENNYSMDKNIKAEITKAFNEVMQWRKENLPKDSEAYKAACNYDKIEPVHINSGLVSAQSRDRYYWTNIPYNGIEYMPEDKGIKLQDILEYGYADREKSTCVARRYAGFSGRPDYLCRRYFLKSFGTPAFKDKKTRDELYQKCKEDPYFWKGEDFEKDPKKQLIRQLSVTEVERLQTLPDGYTDGADVSKSFRYESIGNGWTVDVIAHLLRGFERVNQPKHFKFGI
jgi:site-specific DNA-cytosine methylase